MEATPDIFKAIADPTRREIISMIAKRPLTLNSVAEKFDMSRQAVSLHVKILTDCQLIVIRQQGRERYCQANLGALDEVSTWVAQCKAIWESKLDSLENYLSKLKKTSKHGKRKN